MKSRNILVYFGIIIFIFITSFVLAFGFAPLKIDPIGKMINYGLDIEGGVAIVYEAETTMTGKELDAAVKQSVEVLRKRIDAIGLTEPVIVQQGTNRIRVELPGVKDADQAIESIGKTAQLEFVLVDPSSVANEGMTKADFKSSHILSGKEVKNSGISSDQYGKPAVSLEFNAEGTELFKQATETAKSFDPVRGGQIAILLDDKVISAPFTQITIVDGKAIITGDFTFDEAGVLSSLIRGGALPINLNEIQSTVIGATLGLNALESSIFAAKIGFLLVAVFMIAYYRYPGVVATVSLLLYASLVFLILVGLHATLTLPGIAGIILSVGVAVDANVIISERIKEELRSGKSVKASIEAGYHRAMTTIIDSNVTTFIAAVVLYYFGSGTIQGFAVTLMVGIMVSMFTSIVVTRVLMKSSLSMDFTNNTKLYRS